MPNITGKIIFHWITKLILPLVFTIAAILLAIYYTFKFFYPAFFTTHIEGFKEIMAIGLAITSSGIFLASLKWFQFMGFFKTELHAIISSSEFDKKLETSISNVIYNDDFLSKRNDLEQLWKRVNKALFKNQFSDELASKIEQKMQDLFFHNSNLSHYYKNFTQSVYVSVDEEDYVTVKLKTDAKIISRNAESFQFSFAYSVDKKDEDDSKSTVSIDKIQIADKEYNPSAYKARVATANHLTIENKFQTMLEGRKEYFLINEISLTYPMEKGVEIYELLAERFLDYFKVDVNFSDDLRIIFVPMGTEEFKKSHETPNRLTMIYPGMLLPEKGFKLVLIKK